MPIPILTRKVWKKRGVMEHFLLRPANSKRIRESILTTIRVTIGYENQFPPLNCIQNDSVLIEFDSHKLEQICNPAS